MIVTRRGSVLLMAGAVFALGCSSSSTNEAKGGAGGVAGTSGSGGVSGSSASGGAAATITCGSSQCDIATEKCCFGLIGEGLTATCSPLATACPDGAKRTSFCDDSADCKAQGKEGAICCATTGPVCNPGNPEGCITGVVCAAPAGCPKGSVILCDPAGGTCPSGQNCTAPGGALSAGICK
ncbi:MAG: hypothetical protein IPI67_03700 [Myxococcales bacterium]|nr:hypothetical protein [Myxococcales bacterium]